jgi:hypothetical protein
MAKLRIFVSSTCYDFGILRSELRPFILTMGYEPVMSDYSDILYDPRTHTHDSCLKEIPACDMVVVIIGSRFGGVAIPSALPGLDLALLQQLSTKPGILEFKDKLSITQLEVLKAVEQSVPVYAFVDANVYHDHHVYEKNKDKKEVIDNIEFPSIQKRETARYIFEFINFLSHRATNNSITAFSRLEDIREHLTGQWSQLFQRLVAESKTRTREERRYRDFSESIEDLKAVVLASLGTPGLRETAKGAIRFRRLISFVSSFRFVDHRQLLLSGGTWKQLLGSAKITEVQTIEDAPGLRHEVLLILGDRTFYKVRVPARALDDFEIDWNSFLEVDNTVREAIVDALLEDRDVRRMPMMFYVSQNIETYLAERKSQSRVSVADENESLIVPVNVDQEIAVTVNGSGSSAVELT